MAHMNNEFETAISHFYSPEEFRKLQNSVVGVLGAGGLGSNCAVNLVRSGIRNLIVADYDIVELSNLNRQHYFSCHVGQYKVEALQDVLTALNSNVIVKIYKDKLTTENIPEIYKKADILIEAFDAVEAKSMFLEATISLDVAKIMVSGLAGIGNSDTLRTKKLGQNLYIVGDEHSGVDNAYPYAPRVAIAAAKQADLALSLLLEKTMSNEVK